MQSLKCTSIVHQKWETRQHIAQSESASRTGRQTTQQEEHTARETTKQPSAGHCGSSAVDCLAYLEPEGGAVGGEDEVEEDEEDRDEDNRDEAAAEWETTAMAARM